MPRPSEIGSFRDLGWITGSGVVSEAGSGLPPTLDGAAMFGSGRAALRRLLAHLRSVGVATHSLVHMPDYNCPDVAEAVGEAGWVVRTYDHTPFDPATECPSGVNPGDILINVNLFGVFSVKLTERALERGAVAIEDHTHDPFADLATRSGPQFAFASLRKVLPIPDGGVVYRAPFAGPMSEVLDALDSPARGIDPRYLTAQAMAIKARFLAGDASIDKAAYLELFAQSEQLLATPAYLDVAMSRTSERLLRLAPIVSWRREHDANASALRVGLLQLGLRVLEPNGGIGFGAFVDFGDAALAARVRTDLVDADIYPARLWNLTGLPAESTARLLAERSLFLHADERYGRDDIDRVVAKIADALTKARKDLV